MYSDNFSLNLEIGQEYLLAENELPNLRVNYSYSEFKGENINHPHYTLTFLNDLDLAKKSSKYKLQHNKALTPLAIWKLTSSCFSEIVGQMLFYQSCLFSLFDSLSLIYIISFLNNKKTAIQKDVLSEYYTLKFRFFKKLLIKHKYVHI